MAQDFRNNLQRNVGTAPVTLVTGGDFDAVIGIRICNTTLQLFWLVVRL